MDRWSVQVHRPGLLEFGASDEVETMVLPSAISAGFWCLSGLFSWVELGWPLTGGHRNPMIEHLGPLPMCWFATT